MNARAKQSGRAIKGEIQHKRVAALIKAATAGLPERVMQIHIERKPALAGAYGQQMHALYLCQVKYNLDALAAAVALQWPELIIDYAGWISRLNKSRGIPSAGLASQFECISAALKDVLAPAEWLLVNEYVTIVSRELQRLQGEQTG